MILPGELKLLGQLKKVKGCPCPYFNIYFSKHALTILPSGGIVKIKMCVWFIINTLNY